MTSIIKPDTPKHSNGDISVLDGYMNARKSASFKDFRRDRQQYAEWSDGELHQLALDAGYSVET